MIAGGKEIKSAMLGTEKLSRIYLGESEIWNGATNIELGEWTLSTDSRTLKVEGAQKYLSKGYEFYLYCYGYFQNRIEQRGYHKHHGPEWRIFEDSALMNDNYVAVRPFGAEALTTDLRFMVKTIFGGNGIVRVGSGRNRQIIRYYDGVEREVKFKMAVVLIHPDDEIQTITDSNSQIFYIYANMNDGIYIDLPQVV